jgi:hypothetical protein
LERGVPGTAESLGFPARYGLAFSRRLDKLVGVLDRAVVVNVELG